jgi:uncharacterized protein YcbX
VLDGVMLRLSALYVYPVKSCRGFSPQAWMLEARGLRWDRRWMWASPEGYMLTQRRLPQMARIGVDLLSDGLQVAYPGQDCLFVPLEPGPEASWREATLWGERIRLLDLGSEPARWFASALGVSARLLFQPEEVHRAVDERYGRPGEVVSLADAYPVLLLTEASLQMLSQQVGRPLSVLRFRPNLVLSGAEPFAEDGWERLRIGDAVLRLVKPCRRCLIPAIDPDTGRIEREPLRTLAAFRRWNGGIWFGQNAVPEATGMLYVGQEAEADLRPGA